MAFDRQNLSRMGGANSGSRALWLYRSEDDDYATISGADYFLDAIDELKLGDWLGVEDSGGVHSVSYIDSNDGTAIDIATGLTVTA
jgi:hypothetical protein